MANPQRLERNEDMYSFINACFHLCATIHLPSQGRGAGVGYKSFVHKVYAHPTPTPHLRWEGSGCTRKQVDGFRVFTSALYDAFCRIIARIEAQKGSGRGLLPPLSGGYAVPPLQPPTFCREYSCIAAGIPKPFPAFSAVFESSVCQSQHTKPPVFVNESIGFVHRFH